MKPVTVMSALRLERTLLREIQRIAKRKKRTRSDVIREAISHYIAKEKT